MQYFNLKVIKIGLGFTSVIVCTSEGTSAQIAAVSGFMFSTGCGHFTASFCSYRLLLHCICLVGEQVRAKVRLRGVDEALCILEVRGPI